MSYETQADQALIEHKWQEAELLFNRGLASSSSPIGRFRIRGKLAVSPFYRATAEVDEKNGFRVSDAMLGEVHQQTLGVISDAQEFFTQQCRPDTAPTCIGLLAELSIMCFVNRGYLRQISETLAVPSSPRADQGRNSEPPNDLRIYSRKLPKWQIANPTLTQTKTILRPSNVEGYPEELVFLGYHRLDRGRISGVDPRNVVDPYSLSNLLVAEETHANESEKQELDQACTDILDWIDDWPQIRIALLNELR